MSDTSTHFGTRALIGFLLIIIGGIYLLNSLDVIDFRISRIIFSFPFILFVVGLIILANSRQKIVGIIFTSIGGILLLARILPGFNINAGIIIPVLLIALGIYIIARKSSRNTEDVYGKEHSIKKDVIDDVALFGGGSKVINSDNFRGGSITAIFGGSEIDLTNCKLAEGNQILDVIAIFGGTEISVPRDWNVILNVTPIFGGFSNKLRRDYNAPVDLSKTLIIRGVAIFGGGEVKTR
jgi:predicted membrane protein